MQPPTNEEVTRLLADVSGGDAAAADRLLPIIYDELQGIARHLFAAQTPGQTIQPTILVHDVFMKLTKKTGMEWENRSHFMAVAAKAMRDLLIDRARRRRAEKRGGGWKRLTLSGVGEDAEQEPIDVLDLEEALTELGRIDPRQEQIIELRFFGGLTVEEVANVLNVSERTIMYDWRMARAWLRDRLDTERA